MGKVVSHMTMSLDGFIANPHDGVAEVFGWYEAGTVTVPSACERWPFTVDERSAQLLREVPAATGALVCGRRWRPHQRLGSPAPGGRPGGRGDHRPPRDAGKWTTITFAGRRVTHLRYAARRTGDRPGSPST